MEFEGLHPVFAALYFVGVLVLVMSLIHPVTLALAALAGIAYGVRLKGWQRVGKTLLWQVPMLLIIMVLNPVFNQMGQTRLAEAFGLVVYAESLAYGACMGLLLLATLQWFSNAACVLTSDKIMALLGPVAPTMGLLVTMTMRLVPHFVKRGSLVADARQACTAAAASVGPLRAGVRQTTVLMGWGMEDSLETADAMRARGWGAAGKRTSYVRQRLRAFDIAACAALLALLALCAVCHVAIGLSFSFYPELQGWAPLALYIPFALLLLVPCGLEVACS